MAALNEKNARLRERYPVYVELGMIAALLLAIGAFRFDFTSEKITFEPPPPDDVINVTDLPPTEHERAKAPPPPRRPLPPVERPDDQVLAQEPLDLDPELRLDPPADGPTPPATPSAADEPEERIDFVLVEEKPTLVGGYAALQKAVEYPKLALRAGIEGTVFVAFTVTEDGSVGDLEVLRSPHESLSEEARRVLREEAAFEPGRQRNRPVKVRMSLPLRFTLSQ